MIAFGMLAYLDSYCQTKNEVLVEAEEAKENLIVQENAMVLLPCVFVWIRF